MIVERRGCLGLNMGRTGARLFRDLAVTGYPLSHSTGIGGTTLVNGVSSCVTFVASS